MGDLNAVDFTQEAHAGLLLRAGSWLPHCRVSGQAPLPRGPWLEMLTVDDHCGVAVVSRGQRLTGLAEGRASFRKACEAYSTTPGLRVNELKTVWEHPRAMVLGASIDGNEATIASDPFKRLALLQATWRLLRYGSAPRRLIRQLIGGWTYAACFSRHALSLYQEVYHELGPDTTRDHEVLVLTPRVRDELASLALCAPLLLTRLRAKVLPTFYCTDASPIGGGVDEVTCWMWVNTVDIDTGFEWCICVTEHETLF